MFGDDLSVLLAKRYLEFLLYMHKDSEGFHNLLSYEKRYLDEIGTEDSIGHALWATGNTLNSEVPLMLRKLSKLLFDESLPKARSFTSPRAISFTLLGLCGYSKAFPGDPNLKKDLRSLSNFLVDRYNDNAEKNWQWFEQYATYANPRLPQALIMTGSLLEDESLKLLGEKTLNFLIEIQFIDDIFQPIGTDGWYRKGGERAYFDQQPIEAACMVEACVLAARILGKEKYKVLADVAHNWFHGKNSLELELVDEETYTCFDGLTPKGLNQNKGAESTISYLLSELAVTSEM
jgi:hypothetical protein